MGFSFKLPRIFFPHKHEGTYWGSSMLQKTDAEAARKSIYLAHWVGFYILFEQLTTPICGQPDIR